MLTEHLDEPFKWTRLHTSYASVNLVGSRHDELKKTQKKQYFIEYMSMGRSDEPFKWTRLHAFYVSVNLVESRQDDFFVVVFLGYILLSHAC